MKDLILLGESSTIEFKTEDAHNDSIAKEVVAFANFLGGKVLVGSGDDGRVLGVSDRKIAGQKADFPATKKRNSCDINIL